MKRQMGQPINVFAPNWPRSLVRSFVSHLESASYRNAQDTIELSASTRHQFTVVFTEAFDDGD